MQVSGLYAKELPLEKELSLFN